MQIDFVRVLVHIFASLESRPTSEVVFSKALFHNLPKFFRMCITRSLDFTHL